MPDEDNNQAQVVNEDAAANAAPVETNEDDLASQLKLGSTINDDTETPEAPVDEGDSEQPNDDAPANDEQPEQPSEPAPDDGEPKEETPAERSQRFYEMRQQAKREAQEKAVLAMRDYQPQPMDKLAEHFMEQGYEPFQAEMLARDEIRNQKERISEARANLAERNYNLAIEAQQVLNEYEEFNPTKPGYDESFTEHASQLYESRCLRKDPRSGQILDVLMSPYEFYKSMHDMRSSGMTKAQIKAQKAAEAQLASVMPAASTKPNVPVSPQEKQASELTQAFDII